MARKFLIMLTTIILFIFGFVILIKGADWLVDGSTSIAKRLNISTLVIGLTVVAFGTSAPEFFVSLFGGISGEYDIVIGNILGSNLSNILLILGIASIIFPLSFKPSTVKKEIPLSLVALIILAVMVDGWFVGANSFSGINRVDGLILIALFFSFLYYVYIMRKKIPAEQETEIKVLTKTKSWLMIIFGTIGLAAGGKLIVEGALDIASIFGISQSIIALSIIAIGTSLPELATSITAAYRKNSNIAVGNIIGSNIFNIFWILGISSIIHPLSFSSKLIPDLLVVASATILLFLFMFLGKRYELKRWQGIIFILLYIGYIISLIYR